MSIQDTLNAIKYVAWHDINAITPRHSNSDGDQVAMRMPARDDLLNYVGTGHAGAIYTLAETAAGVRADHEAKALNGFILLKSAEINYTRRAEGELIAQAFVTSSEASDSRQAFPSTGRAELVVKVEIQDVEDAMVFQGTFNYAIRARN